MSRGRLHGKVAIVTGGAGGLGRATVECFVAENARVVIADMDAKAGQALQSALGEAALFVRADVSRAEDVQGLVDAAVAHFGGLHVVVNNAAISGTMHARLLDEDYADFDAVMRVNLLGVMLGTQRAARHMAVHGGGCIVNVASTSGIAAGFGLGSYRVAKAGVIHFSKSAAIDLAGHGVRVNCIAPGNISTGMNAFADPAMQDERARRWQAQLERLRMSSQPLKRKGLPSDVAQAALYLASDLAAQVTGVVLPVDGGIVTGDPSPPSR